MVGALLGLGAVALLAQEDLPPQQRGGQGVALKTGEVTAIELEAEFLGAVYTRTQGVDTAASHD